MPAQPTHSRRRRVPRPALSLALATMLLVVAGAVATAAPQATIPTPEEFFGFAMGTDEKLARWDRIVEYFDVVAERSDRVRVDDHGDTTLGNRFVSLVVTSAANHADIDRYVDIGRRLADGRGVSEQEARALARDGKVTVVLNHNIHSSEIASSQTSVRLIYEMASEDSPEMREILDDVIMVLVPSSNPDGQIMVTDWYLQNLGGDFEEAPMPYLYHHYAGHDNNRDFFMGNLVETRYMFELMFDDWAPQVYLDQHQMGSSGARMFVPPFPDPQSPDVPPLVYQELRLVGGQVVMDLQAAGKKGIITGEMYRIYGQEGALNWRFHNVVGLLTETASARIASPVTQDPNRGGRGGRGGGINPREFSVAVVDPWVGGVWSLGDIVDYQMIAARAVLKVSARNREDFLFNQWLMARETLRRADVEGPYAWVVPIDQDDPNAAADMVRRLMMQGIEVYRAGESFEAIPADAPLPTPGLLPLPEIPEEEESEDDEEEPAAEEPAEEAETDPAGDEDEASGDDGSGDEAATKEAAVPEPVTYAAGSFIIPGAQRGRPALIDLLEPRAPEIVSQWPGGPPLRRYDSTAYTMSMQMGVDVVRVDTEFDAATSAVDRALPPLPPAPADATRGYALDPRLNDSYRAVNELLAAGIEVRRSARPLTTDRGTLPPGAFVVADTSAPVAERMRALSADRRLPVFADPDGVDAATPLSAARIGLYKPWQASMDEGWTRYLLDEYGFPYASVDNARIRAGDLGRDFDVLIIPSGQRLQRLIEGISDERIMDPYAGGIGDEGVAAIVDFVDGGGSLLTFEGSEELVLEHFDVPVKDALDDRGDVELYTPAAVYHLEVDTDHPLGYGMKQDAYAFFSGGSAWEPDGWEAADGDMRVVATWPDEGGILASGELRGDELLARRGAVVEVDHGAGRIVLYGFGVQHRAQAAGTFKLLFNALYGGR